MTFDFAGEERPFPLDAIPRVIDESEWNIIEAGVKQRVATLEAFLDDIYGQAVAVRDGIIPATSLPHQHIFCAKLPVFTPPMAFAFTYQVLT